MRKLGPILLSLAFGSLVACDDNSRLEPETPASATAASDEALSAPDPYDRLNQLRLDAEQAYEALGLQRLPPQRPLSPPGYLQQFERGLPLRENWMNCTRFLTNNPAAGFCEDEPPTNWSPFMFNERRYFVVPLGPTA